MPGTTTPSAAARTPSPITNLLAELHHADHIIKTMLRAMSVQQQARVGAQLEAAGVAGEGMTRHHERAAVIAAATAAPAGATGAKQRIDIVSRAYDVEAQADDIGHLLQATFEKLDDLANAGGPLTTVVAAANCFVTCAVRNVELVRETAAEIIALAQEGGAA